MADLPFSIINYINNIFTDEILNHPEGEVSDALFELKKKLLFDDKLKEMDLVYQGNKNFNSLSSAQTERLALLTEEMGESLQAIGKVLRHGYNAVDPITRTIYDNRKNLSMELGQVSHAMALLAVKDLDSLVFEQAVLDRNDKVKAYLHHQE